MHSQSDNSAKRGQSLEPPHESGSREDRMEVRPEHCPSEVWLQKTTFQAVKDLATTRFIMSTPAHCKSCFSRPFDHKTSPNKSELKKASSVGSTFGRFNELSDIL